MIALPSAIAIPQLVEEQLLVPRVQKDYGQAADYVPQGNRHEVPEHLPEPRPELTGGEKSRGQKVHVRDGVFEAAGFTNAFRVLDMPEDMDPMDARYNVIQWVHRTEPGSSIGPTIVDPRTGEIIKAAVRMDSYRSLVDFNIYAGTQSVDSPDRMDISNWIATLDDSVSAEEFVMARRRQHAAHEVGHTLGLAHNFVAVGTGAMRASAPHFGPNPEEDSWAWEEAGLLARVACLSPVEG